MAQWQQRDCVWWHRFCTVAQRRLTSCFHGRKNRIGYRGKFSLLGIGVERQVFSWCRKQVEEPWKAKNHLFFSHSQVLRPTWKDDGNFETKAKKKRITSKIPEGEAVLGFTDVERGDAVGRVDLVHDHAACRHRPLVQQLKLPALPK